LRDKQPIINLPAPYLKRVALDQRLVSEPEAYPFCLPLFKNGFSFDFKRAITIIVGENGTGKSTLWKASLCSPGSTKRVAQRATGRWIIRVRSKAVAGALAEALGASWLPKLSNGWSSGLKAFSPLPVISTKQRSKPIALRRISCRTRTAKASYGVRGTMQ
jgi:predicted ATPase